MLVIYERATHHIITLMREKQFFGTAKESAQKKADALSGYIRQTF